MSRPAAGQPSARRRMPGPRGLPLLGNLVEFGRDPPRFCLEVARQYGDVARVQLGPLRGCLIAHPDGVQHVLQADGRIYRKQFGYALMKPLLGEGLLISEGARWLSDRRLLQPPFHRRRVGALGEQVTAATAAMLDRWQPLARSGRPFDLMTEMIRLTRGIIGRIIFGEDVDAPGCRLGRALALAAFAAEETAVRSTRTPLALLGALGYLPARPSRRVRQATREADAILGDLIAERRRRGEERDDLLALLLTARDQATGAGLSDRQVRDEVMALFLAGNETTSIALAWTWHLLGQHPAVERRLAAEVAGALAGRPPTAEDLPRLAYARMVVQEALRLYPPTWMLLRTAVTADEIDGWRIPAGMTVVLSPYVTHRDPTLWERPEAFDPERFGLERVADRHRYAYFPFGGGPRQCLGASLALMEAQLILAAVTRVYHLTPAPGPPIELEPLITLRPRHGLPMIASAREPSRSGEPAGGAPAPLREPIRAPAGDAAFRRLTADAERCPYDRQR